MVMDERALRHADRPIVVVHAYYLPELQPDGLEEGREPPHGQPEGDDAAAGNAQDLFGWEVGCRVGEGVIGGRT